MIAILLLILLTGGFAGELPGQQAQSDGPRFVDVARGAGIDFRLTCGTPEKLYIMDAMCGGAAFLDYDNDGWLDILLVNGSTHAFEKRAAVPPRKLYRNQGDGTFADVTRQAGLTRAGWGTGVAVGDYDNDGWVDLYFTFFTGGALYHNNGDGTFRDVTSEAHIGNPGRWGTSTAFADYDRDGFLDLYVANYVDVDPANLPEFGSSPNCSYRGIPVSCGPRGLTGSRDRLYHNNGDGTFADVADSLGIDPDSYYALGVVWGDYNNDGWPDVYVANDSSPSLLYQNDGKGGFSEVGLISGAAFSEDGREQAGMGVDFGDYDNDGRQDIVKTNFSDDSNNLYHNNGDGFFEDRAGQAGLAPLDVPFLAFGVRFADLDNNGWLDVVVANGHVNPQVDQHAFGVKYAQRNFLYRNLGGGRFQEMGQKAGTGFRPEMVSRGLAVGDFNNDGALDLLITNLDGQPQLLRNEATGRGKPLRIRLQGVTSNRDGIGARVEVTAGGRAQVQEMRFNSSFLSASEPVLHFGLGSAAQVDEIVVHWPSGTVDRLAPAALPGEIKVREGSSGTPAGRDPSRTEGVGSAAFLSPPAS